MTWNSILSRALPAQPRLRGVLPRNAVVMVLLAGDEADPEIVFEERAAGIAQSGEIGFPGGMAEPAIDRTVEATGLREASEELGVPVDQFQLLGRLDSLITRWGLQLDVVVCRTALHLQAFQPNPGEVARLFGLKLSWLLEQKPEQYRILVKSHPVRIDPATGEETVLFPAKALNLPERYHQPWGDTVTDVYAYKSHEGLIWGITGDILHDFLERVATAMK